MSEPLFAADRMSSAIRWRGDAGFPLRVDMEVEGPRIRLVRGPDEERSQLGIDLDWPEVFRRLSFLKLGCVTLKRGDMRFLDTDADPKVEIFASDVHAEADNLLRGGESDRSHRTGFAMDFSLRDLDLARMNPALEAYAARGEPPPGMDFSGRFPDRVQDAWSMSGYLLKESFTKAVKAGDKG